MQVWNLTNCKLKANLAGHQGYINTVTVSPDGSLCASGGKVSFLPTVLSLSKIHGLDAMAWPCKTALLLLCLNCHNGRLKGWVPIQPARMQAPAATLAAS